MMKFNFRQNPQKLQDLIENMRSQDGLFTIREEEKSTVNYFQQNSNFKKVLGS